MGDRIPAELADEFHVLAQIASEVAPKVAEFARRWWAAVEALDATPVAQATSDEDRDEFTASIGALPVNEARRSMIEALDGVGRHARR
jgi:hypothetical protein